MPKQSPRLLVLGAHPDDAEYHAGGLAARYRGLGRKVKLVSVTNGEAGHYRIPPAELAKIRAPEAEAAGRVIGVAYEVWEYPDGALEATLDVRHRVIREIRTFEPDLVLTHRPCDYHPDHRAVGQAVQDASYMVTVPGVLTDVPALRKDPVVAYMTDLFTKPYPLEPHVVLDVTDQVDTIVAMLACQASQVFDWLPYEEGILDTVPDDEPARIRWLRTWFGNHVQPRADRFRQALIDAFGEERGREIEWCEAYEISEYAGMLDDTRRELLFPGVAG